MKKLLQHSLIFFALVVFLFGVPGIHVAHADVAGSVGKAASIIANPAGAILGSIAPNVFGTIIEYIALGILNLFAWITAMAGLLLNSAVSFLVIGMGTVVMKGGFGAPIQTLWTIIRNFVNISFAFALIWIGISTIINSGAGSAKKLLASVIISALLVNFSLFFAKATIDISNYMSAAIYKQMVPVGIGDATNSGLSGAFMERMGVVTLITTGGSNVGATDLLTKLINVNQGSIAVIITYALGSSIILFFLAFAFGMGAFLLMIRFVILILLMIFAPLAFLPDMLPGLGKYRKDWWDTLLAQAFVAPVYLFGLYITFVILSNAIPATSGLNGSGSGLAGLFQDEAAKSVPLLLFYAIGVIFLIGTVVVAKKMSSAGAGGTIHAASLAGKMLGGTIAGGAILGRNIGGRIGNKYANSESLKSKASQSGIGGFAARRGLGAARSAKDGSWDLRATKAAARTTGALGIDVGKASDKSYTKRLHKIEKDELEYSESLNVENSEYVKQAKADQVKAEKVQRDAQTEVSDARKARAKPEDIRVLEEIAREKQTLVNESKKRVFDSKTANQREYARTLDKGQIPLVGENGLFGTGFLAKTSIFPLRTSAENHTAAHHITEALDKKKNETNADKISAQLDKLAKNSGGGDHGAAPAAAAHAPAPAATPPAAGGGGGGGHP